MPYNKAMRRKKKFCVDVKINLRPVDNFISTGLSLTG